MKHIVGFSGGIDSQSALRWVRNRYGDENVIATNSNAGENESPITVDFIDRYSKEIFPITHCDAIVADIWKTEGFAETRGLDGNAELDFGMMIDIKGRPPSRKAQFCTEILKLRPQLRWIKKEFGPTGKYAGEEYCRYSGVRRDESDARRNAKFEQWDDYFDCALFYPIADWTKKMCFEYVQAHGEFYNPLYKMGFNRVGCAPCINSSKEDILNWSIRQPEMIDKIRGFEQKTGRTFFAPMVPGLAINTIDDVLRWARSGYGGRQDLLPIMHERPACESKYGLCE